MQEAAQVVQEKRKDECPIARLYLYTPMYIVRDSQ